MSHIPSIGWLSLCFISQQNRLILNVSATTNNHSTVKGREADNHQQLDCRRVRVQSRKTAWRAEGLHARKERGVCDSCWRCSAFSVKRHKCVLGVIQATFQGPEMCTAEMEGCECVWATDKEKSEEKNMCHYSKNGSPRTNNVFLKSNKKKPIRRMKC